MNFLDTLDAEIAAQERILEAHPAYIKLQALRATREVYLGGSVPTNKEVTPISPSGRLPGLPSAGKSADAVRQVIDYLRVMGTPIRTYRLLDYLNNQGIHFSGNTPQNVLASLLSRSPDVVSKGGHVGWALKEWDTAGDGSPPSSSPPADIESPAQGRKAGPGGGT